MINEFTCFCPKIFNLEFLCKLILKQALPTFCPSLATSMSTIFTYTFVELDKIRKGVLPL